METTAHFEQIPQEIARRLGAAIRDIVVAVAWFTDPSLFDVLCKQAGRGLRVRLAVLNDRINVGAGRLNFQRLQECGGQLFLIPAGGDRDPIMHHKFCVIDRATVIIGSYNWTRRAQGNDESITVIADGPDIAADATDQEIADLRLTLRDLEYQVTARSDDKAEIERLVHGWTRPAATGRLDGKKLQDLLPSDQEVRPQFPASPISRSRFFTDAKSAALPPLGPVDSGWTLARRAP